MFDIEGDRDYYLTFSLDGIDTSKMEDPNMFCVIGGGYDDNGNINRRLLILSDYVDDVSAKIQTRVKIHSLSNEDTLVIISNINICEGIVEIIEYSVTTKDAVINLKTTITEMQNKIDNLEKIIENLQVSLLNIAENSKSDLNSDA